MFLRRILIFFSIFSFAGVQGGRAQEAGPLSSDFEKLISLSGVETAFRSIETEIDGQIQPALTSVNPEVAQVIRNALHKGFEANRLSKSILSKLKNSITADETRALISWYETRLGKSLRATSDFNPDQKGQQVAFLKSLEKTPPDSTRVKILADILAESGAFEVATQGLISLTENLTLGLNSALPQGRRQSEATIKQKVHQGLQRHQEILARTMIGQGLFNTKDFSELDLYNYLIFIRSPSSQRFFSAFKLALKNTLFEATPQIQKNIARNLASIKKH